MKKHIGIIGHGFVGKAVEYGFDTPETVIRIADPKYAAETKDLFTQKDFNPEIVFICVPTPMGHDGSINADILLSVCHELRDHGNSCVAVIKSTVTPDKLRECFGVYENLVYSPEFLRERTANEDFINPDMHVFGSDHFKPASEVVALYNDYSRCAPCPYFLVKPEVASLIKYTINSFLATKVTFFNELYDVFEQMNLTDDYDDFTEILACDPRMGTSHMQVPGPDGRRGFGGACFAKDTAALLNYVTKEKFCVLDTATKVNASNYRGQYDDLDKREKEQNVNYGFNVA